MNHQDVYVFGVWKAPSAANARETIAEVSANIQLFAQDETAQPHNSTTSHDTEKPSGDYLLPYLTNAKPETLLPKDAEVGNWVRAHKPTTYNADTLYKDRFVADERYPQIYHDYGFQTQAEVEYQNPKFGSDPYVLLEIFDMGTPENAFGIFSVRSYPQPTYEWVGCKAIISGRNLWFWKGKYFIQIEGYAIATGIREAMIQLARATAKRIEDPPQKIPLLALFPRHPIRGSEKLFKTHWALHQINKTLPHTFPQLVAGATGVLAQYNITDSQNTAEPYYAFVIRYPNKDTAESAYTQYRNHLISENRVFETDTENGAILIKE